uniref:Uncharacterized protein n=1 Tax=Romanomermis culicivorax TaxID=13658 RepID=A0A915HVN6_ROMCU
MINEDHDGDADPSATKIAGKGGDGKKIVGEEGEDATKIVGKGGDATKIIGEDNNAMKIAGEGGKILTDKQKQEMADLSLTNFSPEAKTYFKDIANSCDHLHPEVGLPMGCKKDNTLTPEEQYKMYPQLFSQYLTIEHKNAQPATLILKQKVIEDSENDGANLEEKEKMTKICLNGKFISDRYLILYR